MSYANEPELNPYAAPQSAVIAAEYGQRSKFYGWAGFWRRFAALVIDTVIVILGAGLVGGVVGGIVGASGGLQNGQLPASLTLGLRLAGNLFQLCYFVLMESSSSQATLGKMALGIKVTDMHGQRISLLRAFGRYFAKILSYLTFGIGFLMAGFTERKQALHDMVAGTLVVKSR